jgi:ketosteroid isomerase-like protein
MALNTEFMTKVVSDMHAPAALSSSIAIVQAVYAVLAVGPLDSVGVFLADDVEFELHDATNTMNGSWSGRGSVLAAMVANFAKVDQQKPVVKGMLADGNTVAVLLSETGVMKASGQPYSATAVHWFTIEASSVRRIEAVIALTL